VRRLLARPNANLIGRRHLDDEADTLRLQSVLQPPRLVANGGEVPPQTAVTARQPVVECPARPVLLTGTADVEAPERLVHSVGEALQRR
jgi:hypothetical protein